MNQTSKKTKNKQMFIDQFDFSRRVRNAGIRLRIHPVIVLAI